MAQQRIRVIWWNVQDFGGENYQDSTRANERLETIAGVLSYVKPDIFVLLEVVGSSQENLPYSKIYSLLKILQNKGKGSGLTNILMPVFAGYANRAEAQHSMAVFFNNNTVEPTQLFSIQNYIKSQLNNYSLSQDKSKIYGSKLLRDVDSSSRYPILSAFKLKKVNNTPLLNIYSIHAKNPYVNGQINNDFDKMRKDDINALAAKAKANATDANLTVIGGDFNGPPPENIGANWINCFHLTTEEKQKLASHNISGVNYTHNIRGENWTLQGDFPAYQYLNQPGLDKILWYSANANVIDYIPWIVNPILGSLPLSSETSQGYIYKFGYLKFPWDNLANVRNIIKDQISYGMRSLIGEKVYLWQDGKTLINGQPESASKQKITELFNSAKIVQRMYYVSDHLPIAIDLYLQGS